MRNLKKIRSTLVAILVLTISLGINEADRSQTKTVKRQNQNLPDKIVVKFKDRLHLAKSALSTGITSVDALFSEYGITDMQPVLKTRAMKKI